MTIVDKSSLPAAVDFTIQLHRVWSGVVWREVGTVKGRAFVPSLFFV